MAVAYTQSVVVVSWDSDCKSRRVWVCSPGTEYLFYNLTFKSLNRFLMVVLLREKSQKNTEELRTLTIFFPNISSVLASGSKL